MTNATTRTMAASIHSLVATAVYKWASGMASEATSTRAGAVAAVRDSEAFRAAWRVAVSTRAAVLLVAVFAALSFGPAAGGLARQNAEKFDDPSHTHVLADPLLAPLARWDSVWYLRIADSGYGDSAPRAAFFPLYPLLVRGLATPFGASEAALLLAAYTLSLAAFLAALFLLHRLTELELGRRLARPTLLLLAVFPAAVYFGAPYSESLFLLLGVGAFYAARTGRWAWAGACAGLASATRSAGLLLLIPLAMLWWASRPRRSRDAAWLALAPLKGAWDGLVAAVDGVRQLASGSRTPVYFEAAVGDPFRIAAINVMLFVTLMFAVLACVGVWRRLPRAYGAWVAVSLLLPLTFPVTPQPLMSLPRFVAVLFPLFMWLAIVCDERRITDLVAAAFAVGLGLFTAEYASWHWIS